MSYFPKTSLAQSTVYCDLLRGNRILAIYLVRWYVALPVFEAIHLIDNWSTLSSDIIL